jgi:hypothetical protein
LLAGSFQMVEEADRNVIQFYLESFEGCTGIRNHST